MNDNPDDFNHAIGEIVISPVAQPNVNGLPLASSVLLSHSSDLRTLQKIFHVAPRFSWATPYTPTIFPACSLKARFRPTMKMATDAGNT